MYRHYHRSRTDTPTCLALICVVFVVAFLGLPGLGLLIGGGIRHARVEANGPDQHFTSLGYACDVQAVKHCWFTETHTTERRCHNNRRCGYDTTYTCEDTYEYTFNSTYTGTAGLNSYTSKTEQVQRWSYACSMAPSCYTNIPSVVPDPADNGMGAASHSFELGEKVRCWRPNDVSEVPLDIYTCGNSPCLKIFDPSGEYSGALTVAIILLSTGGGLLGLVLLISPCLLACVRLLKKRAKEREQVHGYEAQMAQPRPMMHNVGVATIPYASQPPACVGVAYATATAVPVPVAVAVPVGVQ